VVAAAAAPKGLGGPTKRLRFEVAFKVVLQGGKECRVAHGDSKRKKELKWKIERKREMEMEMEEGRKRSGG